MTRQKIANTMIKYLEDRINCENVMKYAEQMKPSDDSSNKLVVDDTIIAFEIIEYEDADDVSTSESDDDLDQINHMFEIFDFMTEASYTGFEYFPYIYGVLNCHDAENSRVYVYYETSEGTLMDLIAGIRHTSEWYDVVFQIIMTNYYIQVMNKYQYDGPLENYLYTRLKKSYFKKYTFGEIEVNVNHLYVIMLWDTDHLSKMEDAHTPDKIVTVDLLLKYLTDNQNKLDVQPSNRIIRLLHDINKEPAKTLNILAQYYGPDKNVNRNNKQDMD